MLPTFMWTPTIDLPSCAICGKPKGQLPDRCPGHYALPSIGVTTQSWSPYSEYLTQAAIYGAQNAARNYPPGALNNMTDHMLSDNVARYQSAAPRQPQSVPRASLWEMLAALVDQLAHEIKLWWRLLVHGK